MRPAEVSGTSCTTCHQQSRAAPYSKPALPAAGRCIRRIPPCGNSESSLLPDIHYKLREGPDPFTQARAIVHGVCGTVVHVHMEEGGRISYEPYRAAGRAFIKALKTLNWCVPVRALPSSWRGSAESTARSATCSALLRLQA